MVKKRSKRSGKRKRPRDKPTSDRSVSAAVQRVGERIAEGGSEYVKSNFVRILMGSADLRSEKEFADFCLEPMSLLEVAARRFPRFRRRAKRAVRRGVQDSGSIYDDYRIAVLNDLDTPQLRQQLQSRLHRCVNRLKYGQDEDKFEIAILLSMFLSDRAKILKGKKPLPLGAYALVTIIYEDSFDRAMETIPEVWDIVGGELYELWCLRHKEADRAAIESAVEELETFEELSARLESDHRLAQAWERQKPYLREALAIQLASGAMSLDPSFFAPDEIALAMLKMEQRHWGKPWSLSRYVAFLAMGNFVTCIHETVDEVVSPQRFARLTDMLKTTGQGCVASGEEQLRSWVPGIQTMIDDLLEAETPSQSRAIHAFYLQGFLEMVKEDDAIGPRWRWFLKRLKESRILWRLSGGDL